MCGSIVERIFVPCILQKIDMGDHQAACLDAHIPSRLLTVFQKIELIMPGCRKEISLTAIGNILQREHIRRLIDDGWFHPPERDSLKGGVGGRDVRILVVCAIIHIVVAPQLVFRRCRVIVICQS